MITNNFNYAGKVSIEVTRNGHLIRKRYTNSGTSDLFKMFAYALTGRDISKMVPAYFTLSRGGDGAENENASIALPIIKIYYPEVLYSGGSSINNVCRLQCNLPLSKIEQLRTMDSGAYSLNIFSYEDKKLASVAVSGDSFEGLSPSDQVIIVWDLYVTNYAQNTEGE